MPNPETILKWLKEAGAYAFQREDPELLTIDLLVGASTIGVRVTPGDRQQVKSLSWTQIERLANNPLLRLLTK